MSDFVFIEKVPGYKKGCENVMFELIHPQNCLPCQGVAFIVANDYKGTPRLPDSKGAAVDFKLMNNFFVERLKNYFVIPYRNINAKDLMSIFKYVASKPLEYEAIQRIVFYFSGHGGLDHITMQDGKPVCIAEIETILAENLPVNIPKILLFDTCRSGSADHGTRGSNESLENNRPEPSFGNILLGYSSLRGHTSRGDIDGGYWTTALYQYLISSKPKNIVEVLDDVNTYMSSKRRYDDGSVKMWSVQPSQYTNSLIKPFPILWEDAGHELGQDITRTLSHKALINAQALFPKMINDLKLALQHLEVHNLIITFCAADSTNTTVFSDFDAFQKLQTQEDFWFEVGKEFSVVEHKTIGVSVKSLDVAEAITIFENFSVELIATILKDLNLVQFYKEEFKDFEPSGNKHKLIVRYESKNLDVDTTDEKLVRNVLYEAFGIKDDAIRFDHAATGSILLIYKISLQMKNHLHQYKPTATEIMLLCKWKITHLIVDGEVELKVPSKSIDENTIIFWTKITREAVSPGITEEIETDTTKFTGNTYGVSSDSTVEVPMIQPREEVTKYEATKVTGPYDVSKTIVPSADDIIPVVSPIEETKSTEMVVSNYPDVLSHSQKDEKNIEAMPDIDRSYQVVVVCSTSTEYVTATFSSPSVQSMSMSCTVYSQPSSLALIPQQESIVKQVSLPQQVSEHDELSYSLYISAQSVLQSEEWQV